MYTPFDSVKNVLSKLGVELDREFNAPRIRDIYCEKCGTSLVDFLETGFVSCSNCYETFKQHAREFASDIHGRTAHVGKVPKKEVTRANKKRELERLIHEKEIAVQKEEYQLADELKIKIARLREEL